MGTFRKIDYRLRPSKNIERKMMIDILQRLPNIHNLKDYKYIGFGSTYFSDVKLVHKRLGINDIISIEKEKDSKPRFVYNKPFDCVDMIFEKSYDILPELDWSQPVILWLDYDEELEKEMLNDIKEFMTSAVAGSVIFITINAHPRNVSKKEDNDRTMVDEIKDNLSPELVPTDVSKKDVRGWGYGDVCRRIIMNQIEKNIYLIEMQVCQLIRE